MSKLATYRIEYWAWPEGARIKSSGVFDIAATSREDAIEAAQNRWPGMNITLCDIVEEDKNHDA